VLLLLPPPQVTGTEIPTPYSANLEALAFPKVEDIVRMARQVVGK
jgi:pyruvate/2-oxoglutarate/acetoin dehydrogenase E1 component